MSAAYLSLAAARSSKRYLDYHQPEDFGYDFRRWVSPYTVSAHNTGSVALVLQDWFGATALTSNPHPDIQRLGRDADLKTNKYLEDLVRRVFNLALEECYITNAFPYIKLGNISAPVPRRHVMHTVETFTKPELAIAKPRIVLALGRLASASLSSCGVDCVALPHPAARIGSVQVHEIIWKSKINAH